MPYCATMSSSVSSVASFLAQGPHGCYFCGYEVEIAICLFLRLSSWHSTIFEDSSLSPLTVISLSSAYAHPVSSLSSVLRSGVQLCGSCPLLLLAGVLWHRRASLFNHSHMERHLRCLQFGAIRHKTAMNFCLKITYHFYGLIAHS